MQQSESVNSPLRLLVGKKAGRKAGLEGESAGGGTAPHLVLLAPVRQETLGVAFLYLVLPDDSSKREGKECGEEGLESQIG